MTQQTWRWTVLVAAAAILFTGCAGTGQSGSEQPGPTEDAAAAEQEGAPDGQGADSTGDGAEARGLAESASAESGALAGEEEAKAKGESAVPEPEKHRVFFEFDSAELSDEARQLIRDHADYIQSDEEVQVTLEGHTDERGSREYNLALGERRAKSVRRVLLVHGVDQDRIEIVSFGEEEPLVEGDTEEAYAKNRRVRIRYER